MRTLPTIRQPPRFRGRGVSRDPPNRFERLHVELEEGALDVNPLTEYIDDSTRSIISTNRSPDLGFDASVNPYRGCEHGCVYCYARPSHEYLGFSSGLDFERKILVKRNAPELLRKALARPSWEPQVVAMSGVTDPYQPVERKLGITRGCLKVLQDFLNPVTIVTKNHLVTRDVDILRPLAEADCAHVTVSITTLRNDLQRVMEPRTTVPARRLAAVSELAEAGIPVGVFVAPVIPGLTDVEIPAILTEAARAGAGWASFIPLRLPGAVAEHFVDWLELHFPDRRNKVLARVREARGGKLNDSDFHTRFRARGEYAGQIRALFNATASRLGLDARPPRMSTENFRRSVGQGELF